MTRGACLCGAVSFRIDGPMRDILARHVLVADKGYCYEIADGLTQHDSFSGAEHA